MSFYLRDGEHLRATPLTRGPWDPAHQHGGPPCALLAGAVARWGEGATGPEGFAVARFAAEYARPVPVDAHLEVRVEPDRLGGQVQRFDATLLADGREAIRARVLRVRRAPLPVTAEPPPDAPHTLSDFSFPFFAWEPAYHTAVQLRLASGTWGRTPVVFWGRPRVALVDGEPTHPVERLVLLADAQSGMGPPLDVRRHTFVNPDLTVLLGREPDDGWLRFEVRSFAGPDGAGLAESALMDAQGPVGRAAQTLVVARRP